MGAYEVMARACEGLARAIDGEIDAYSLAGECMSWDALWAVRHALDTELEAAERSAYHARRKPR